MSVLHPVGPEASETYWARRVIVIVAVVVVLAALIAAIVNATRGNTATPAPAARPTVAAAASPTPTSISTELRTPGAPSPSTSSSSSSKPSPAAKSSGPKSSKPSPSSDPNQTATVTCPADKLRVTLTGKHRLKVKQSTTFNLSVINGSPQTCVAAITPDNFELKIYSGNDRIWSTNDCAAKVKKINKTLAAERSTSWTMSWNGRRSKASCKQPSEIPRAGTYFVTAQLKDAKPVQLRMILRG